MKSDIWSEIWQQQWLSCYFFWDPLGFWNYKFTRGDKKKKFFFFFFVFLSNYGNQGHGHTLGYYLWVIVSRGGGNGEAGLNMQTTPGCRTEKCLFQINVNSSKGKINESKMQNWNSFCQGKTSLPGKNTPYLRLHCVADEVLTDPSFLFHQPHSEERVAAEANNLQHLLKSKRYVI